MSRRLFSLVALFAAFSAHAGHITYESIYSPRTIVQGVGPSLADAKADALAAIPKSTKDPHGGITRFVIDQSSSPSVDCTATPGAISTTISNDRSACDPRVPGNLVRITVPLISVTEYPIKKD